jgi:hypothetical protein
MEQIMRKHVACLWLSLKYAGTVMTASVTFLNRFGLFCLSLNSFIVV